MFPDHTQAHHLTQVDRRQVASGQGASGQVDSGQVASGQVESGQVASAVEDLTAVAMCQLSATNQNQITAALD